MEEYRKEGGRAEDGAAGAVDTDRAMTGMCCERRVWCTTSTQNANFALDVTRGDVRRRQ